MSHFKFFFFSISVFTSVFYCRGDSKFEVELSGKPIQRDGFLLEWRLDKAWMVDTANDIRIDAMNTTRGLAGYIRYMSHDTCSPWVFRFHIEKEENEKHFTIIPLKSRNKYALYSVDTIQTDTALYSVAEWMFPWDSLGVNSASRTYRLRLEGDNKCDDTLKNIVITGNYQASFKNELVSKKLVTQIAIIVLLLFGYIFLSVRARKYKKYSKRTMK